MASRGALIFSNVNVARSRSDGHDETQSSSRGGDAWSFPECQISIRGVMQAMTWERSIKALMSAIRTVQLTSTCNRTAEKIRGRIPRSWCDRTAIVVHLERSWHTITPRLMTHDHRAIVAINPTFRQDKRAAKIGRNFPLKRGCIPLFFLNF